MTEMVDRAGRMAQAQVVGIPLIVEVPPPGLREVGPLTRELFRLAHTARWQPGRVAAHTDTVGRFHTSAKQS
jgi:hypothetical protein